MAKRKAKKRTSRRRRSSMGAVGTGMTQILGLLAGAVAGKMLRSKVLPNVDQKFKSIGEVAVGVVLPRFVKNDFVKAMGAGMIVDGGTAALSSFGILNGIGADDTTVEFIGADDIDTIAGVDETISGDDDMMSGSADIQTIAGIGEDEIGAFEDEMYS